MKTGKSITELAALLEEQKTAKKDFVASTALLEYLPDYIGPTDLKEAFQVQQGLKEGRPNNGALRFKVGASEHVVEPTRHCLQQIGNHTGIPSRYLDRMVPEDRDLLAHNINHWFKKEPTPRMLRTLMNGTNSARAFLSNRYRPLDNAQLAEVVLPKLLASGCEVLSSEITEKRLYIQAATPKLEIDIAKLMKERGIVGLPSARPLESDIVRAGLVISNSEVGCGAISIEHMVYRLACYNGMIMPSAVRRNHVGRRNDVFAELDSAAEFFSDKTRELDDKAFFAKVSDVVDAVFNLEGFTSIVDKFARAKAQVLPEDVTEVIEIVTDRFRLNETEGKSVLKHLAAGGDLSLFGLVNAVTRTAEDVESYDRAIEFERMGGEVLELPQTVWGKH